MTGEIGGVVIDAQNHVFVVQRVSDKYMSHVDGHLEGLTGDADERWANRAACARVTATEKW